MSENYKDIEGPMTMLVNYVVKPECITEFTRWHKAYIQFTQEGKHPGSLSVEIARHENHFAIWQKFADSDDMEFILFGADLKREDIFEWIEEPPIVRFFSTTSISGPKS